MHLSCALHVALSHPSWVAPHGHSTVRSHQPREETFEDLLPVWHVREHVPGQRPELDHDEDEGDELPFEDEDAEQRGAERRDIHERCGPPLGRCHILKLLHRPDQKRGRADGE